MSAGVGARSFEIHIGTTTMVCGYCGETETEWPGEPNMAKARPHFMLGHLRLTGIWSLAVGPAGELVVVAEVETLAEKPAGHLSHLCQMIPAEVYEQHRTEITESVGMRAVAR